MITTALIGLLPFQRLRKFLYEYAALTCFRILSRSFSVIVKFHNLENRPRSDGICVANHTTPVDVVILQIDRTYALVRSPKHGAEPSFQSNPRVESPRQLQRAE